MKKIISICLCIFMIFIQITPMHAIEPTTADLDFHAYLSDYLDDNYLLDKIDDSMAHHYLHDAMVKEFGDTNITLTLVNIANDWGYPLKGKTGLYEQILLEMIVNYVNSDVFQQRLEEDKIKTENEVLSFLKKSFDFDYLADDYKELYSILKKAEFKSWKDLSKVPDEVFNKSIKELIEHNKIPISNSYLLNVAYDYVDLLTKCISYMSVCNQLDGIIDVLEEMLHYSDDSDLRSAIIKILNKLNSIHPNDIWSAFEANSLDFVVDSIIHFNKDIIMTCLGSIGLAIETSGFISNVLFKTDEIAKSYVLLKSEIEIENLIKKVIKVKQNTYMHNKADAKILNFSLLFLYDAYDYGINLMKKYGEKVLYVDYFKDLLKIDVKDEQNQYRDFTNKVKTWEGIISNHRSLFHSGWLEYKELYLANLGSLQDAFGDSYVNGIYFDESSVVVPLVDAKTSYPLNGCKNMPNNTSMTYTYTSSDPSIVSIENKNIYRIKAHQAGSVTITAKSEDGLYRATQKVIIVDGSTSENKTFETEKDYSKYYHENEDGITLTGIVKDFIEYNFNSDLPTYVYRIPSTINGKTVTELDFSQVRMREDPHLDTNFFDQVVIPNTVKRIADGCFSCGNHTYECEFILPEGIEEIGAYAFHFVHFTNKDVVLPTSLKKLGEGAFDTSYYDSIYINCPNLTEIPKNCFEGSLNREEKIIFSNDMKQLKKIGEQALCEVDYVSLPDCVEVLEKRALSYSRIDRLPASLKEIREEALYNTKLSTNKLPANVKMIGKKAFYNNKIETLSIPNNVEYIGEKAFIDIDNVIVYGENTTSNGTLDGDIGSYTYFEIPHTITNIEKDFTSKTVVWTNGINEIKQEPKKAEAIYGKQHKSLYLTNIERQGSYALENHIFSPHSYFDYIEIPVNYLENTQKTLSGDWIFNGVIVGAADERQLKKYVEILKDAIDVGGSITHRDEQGNLTLLYQNLPLSFEKTSKSKYENQSDYIVSPIKLLKYQKNDNVSDMKITLSSDDYVGKLDLQCWEEGNETKAQRMNALGDFMVFEDVYLYQPFHRYFTIHSETKGPYVISLELEGYELTKSNVALYHISNTAEITRIPLQIEKLAGYDKKITFKTERLGQFALVKLLYKEEKIETSYRDEYLYDEAEKVIDHDSSVEYETEEGNQSFIGTEENQEVVIVKPNFNVNNEDSKDENKIDLEPMKDKITDTIIQDFELDNTLIQKKEESVEISEEALSSLDTWQSLSHHGILLQSNQDTTIQMALDEVEDGSYDFHVYQINDDGSVKAVDYEIHSIKEENVNSNIQDSHQEYYEYELDEGTYFVTYLEGAEKHSILNTLFSGIKFVLGIIGIGFAALVLLVIIGSKKRRRRT